MFASDEAAALGATPLLSSTCSSTAVLAPVAEVAEDVGATPGRKLISGS